MVGFLGLLCAGPEDELDDAGDQEICVILHSTQKLLTMIENQVFRQGLQTSLIAGTWYFSGRQLMAVLGTRIHWTGS